MKNIEIESQTIEIDDSPFYENRILISYNAITTFDKETVEIHGSPNEFNTSSTDIEITDVKMVVSETNFKSNLTIQLTDIINNDKYYLEYFKNIISQRLIHKL